MRKLLLGAIPALSLAFMTPAFSQGIQTPSAPNATPPTGTIPNVSTGNATRLGSPRHRRPMRRRVVALKRPAQQTVQDPSGR